jgi:hypothetical protein
MLILEHLEKRLNGLIEKRYPFIKYPGRYFPPLFQNFIASVKNVSQD